ncbi:MAG: penicillin-binding transpeptidase domain-containing protein [Mobiluncus porci]|uniref:Penicillin-binding protein 2 n=1 Tax=Mobiluncus porci TaxID=2652278 RepID=A0A7K0K0N2_9ACTO|nr:MULTISPECIES: penicillin-binding transpeptidase domain-containing protein [Mobiluncus]MCI6585246.1 penicillin-binding protein 2 [Mobiluncus sp.]MDD7541099.1 penicillin-binding transpeptidase domain-containing protein [Mobiluncus porci]MDY5747558.1 penicillin-binding transpeptidase domain-containing protein [Mobiluncus porci]MST49046.1 penicillin-binding protein 2 [Mobiluncus porci]
MNSQIRKLYVALTIMVLALMLAMTYHSFIDAPNLNANDRNRRVTDAYWGKERGKIVAGDVVLAQSVPNGTGTNVRYQRSYPEGAKYAHITGYFPAAVQGQVTEMEKEVGPILSGQSDALWIQRLQDLFIGSQPQGGNVSLTINPKVQDACVAALQGKNGAAVALNPTTGEILGMCSSPSFDPNTLSSPDGKQVLSTYEALRNDPSKPLLNRAISELYPPGSTFKIVTAAALLSSGQIQPDTVVDAPDSLPLPGSNKALVNYMGESCGNGKVPFHYAFAQSCNTPFGQLGMNLGGEPLKKQAEAFGFGVVPEIPMTGAASQFPLPEAPSFLANAAIGQQSVRATPLQMAMVASAVANGGLVMQPYLVNQELSSDFQVIKQFAPKEAGRAVTPEVAGAIRTMMQEVVQSGSGKAAALPGISVAGKTGTAETGIGAGKDQWFVGFAPAESPRIAVAVVIEDPQGVLGTGGVTAAPLARGILQAGVN